MALVSFVSSESGPLVKLCMGPRGYGASGVKRDRRESKRVQTKTQCQRQVVVQIKVRLGCRRRTPQDSAGRDLVHTDNVRRSTDTLRSTRSLPSSYQALAGKKEGEKKRKKEPGHRGLTRWLGTLLLAARPLFFRSGSFPRTAPPPPRPHTSPATMAGCHVK